MDYWSIWSICLCAVTFLYLLIYLCLRSVYGKNADKYETRSKRVSYSQARKWKTVLVWSPWEAHVFNQLTKKIDKNHLIPHKKYRVVLTLYGQWIKYRESVTLELQNDSKLITFFKKIQYLGLLFWSAVL